MIKVKKKELVEVGAKTLKLTLKVRDEFSYQILDNDGKTVVDKDGCYVPDFMPGEHYGDYVLLDIDMETGQITNWPKPNVLAQKLQDMLDNEEED